MDEFTMMILKIVIAVCAAVITYYVVPYIKTLKEDARYAAVLEMIEIAVRAAEQVIKGNGALKKSEVVKFITDWTERNGINISEDQLDQLIEAAVYDLKQEA
jgi:LL-H family phage holin